MAALNHDRLQSIAVGGHAAETSSSQEKQLDFNRLESLVPADNNKPKVSFKRTALKTAPVIGGIVKVAEGMHRLGVKPEDLEAPKTVTWLRDLATGIERERESQLGISDAAKQSDWYQGLESAGSSIAQLVATAPLGGPLVRAATVAGMYGGGAYGRARDDYLKAHPGDVSGASGHAATHALAETLPEFASNYLTLGVGKALGGVGKSLVAGKMKDAIVMNAPRAFAELAKSIGGELATENITTYTQALADRLNGVSDRNEWDVVLDQFGSTAVASLVFGFFGGGAGALNRHAVKQELAKPVASPKEVQSKLDLAQSVASEIQQKDPVGASHWLKEAQRQITNQGFMDLESPVLREETSFTAPVDPVDAQVAALDQQIAQTPDAVEGARLKVERDSLVKDREITRELDLEAEEDLDTVPDEWLDEVINQRSPETPHAQGTRPDIPAPADVAADQEAGVDDTAEPSVLPGPDAGQQATGAAGVPGQAQQGVRDLTETLATEEQSAAAPSQAQAEPAAEATTAAETLSAGAVAAAQALPEASAPALTAAQQARVTAIDQRIQNILTTPEKARTPGQKQTLEDLTAEKAALLEPAAGETATQPQEAPATYHTPQTQAIREKYAGRNAGLERITDRPVRARELYDDVKDPTKQEALERRLKDRVLGDHGVVKLQDADDAVKELEAENIPYVVEVADGGNIKGLNAHYNEDHARADDDMREVFGKIYAAEVRRHGGIIARDQGDEFKVIWPNFTVEEVREIRADIEAQIRTRVKELGIDNVVHGRHNLPTGALYTNYGLVQGRPGQYRDVGKEADESQGLMKRAFEAERAKALGYTWDERTGTYGRRSLEPAARLAEERQQYGSGAVSGQKQDVAGSGSFQGGADFGLDGGQDSDAALAAAAGSPTTGTPTAGGPATAARHAGIAGEDDAGRARGDNRGDDVAGTPSPGSQAAAGTAPVDQAGTAGRGVRQTGPARGGTESRGEVDTPRPSSDLDANVLSARGDTATLLTTDGELGVAYEVREAADLIPSHDPRQDFKKNDAYPDQVQERAYHRDEGERQKVVGNALRYDARYVVTDNPDATNGPPVVTSEGVVLGGNSRVMTQLLAYNAHDNPAMAEYRRLLKKRADRFGIAPDAIDQFKEPVLVRVLTEPAGSREDMARLARVLNQTKTQGLADAELGVSKARLLSTGTIDALATGLEQFDTLREFLGRAASRDFINAMIQDGVIEQTQVSMLTTKDGLLNDNGKNLVEKVLVGRVIQDADALAKTPPFVRQKIVSALPDLVVLSAQQDGWNLNRAIQQASNAIAGYKAEGAASLETYLGQATLPGVDIGTNLDSTAKTLAFALEGMTPTGFKAKIKELAAKARTERESRDQTMLMAGVGLPMSPSQALNAIFGAPKPVKKAKGGQASMFRRINNEVLFRRAYHGTHARGIERFSLEKIGTGEGAQLFGWGLYFAQEQRVAESYREKLSADYFRGERKVTRDGVEMTPEEVTEYIAAAIPATNKEYAHDLAASFAESLFSDGDISSHKALVRYMLGREHKQKRDSYLAAIEAAEQLQVAKNKPSSPGQLYEVEVPEDHELLDWDKPLSEQPKEVQAKLKDLPKVVQRKIQEKGLENVTGEDLYDTLTSMYRARGAKNGQQNASLLLDSIGIPGLRYLDGNSRSDGQGTHNFVIWKEDVIEIVQEHYRRAQSGKGNVSGVQAADVRQALAPIQKAAKNAMPVEVVQSQEELPAHILEANDEAGGGTVDGVYDPRTKKIYLVADNLAPEHSVAGTWLTHAIRAWAHEQGHHGIRGFFKETFGQKWQNQFDDFLETVHMQFSGTAAYREMKQLYPEAGKYELAEELFMRHVMEKVATGQELSRKEQGLWRRFVNFVKGLLGHVDPQTQYSQDELQRVALGIMDWLKGGTQAQTATSEMFSRTQARNFAKNSQGDDVFGVVPASVAKAWGGKAAEIRLEEGDSDSGLRHIEKNHGDQIRSLGFKNAIAFVEDVLDNYTAVFQGEGRSLFLTVKNKSKRWDSIAIKMEYDPVGDFYTIKTAMPMRKTFFEADSGRKKKNLLWEGAPTLHQAKGLTPGAVSGQRSVDANEGIDEKNVSIMEAGVKDGSTPRFSFAGPKARGANVAGLDQAKQMQAKGESREGPKPQDRLVVLHNLTADNLRFIAGLGGKIPVPSLGITKAATPYSGFGEISLIGTKGLADPAQQPVFSADAYSTRFPKPIWPKVKIKPAQALMDRFRAAFQKADDMSDLYEVWDAMVNTPDRDKALEYFVRSSGARIAYLQEQGKEFTPPTKEPDLRYGWSADKDVQRVAEEVRDAAMNDFNTFNSSDAHKRLTKTVLQAIERQADPKYVEKWGVSKLKNMFGWDGAAEGDLIPFGVLARLYSDMQKVGQVVVDYGATRSQLRELVPDTDADFTRWAAEQISPLYGEPSIKVNGKKVPFTAENIVEAMASNKVRNQEKTMAFGPGQVRAAASTRFKTLKELQAARDRVVSPEAKRQHMDNVDAVAEQFRMAVLPFYKFKNSRGEVDTWTAMDDSMEALAKAVKQGGGYAALKAALRQKDFVGVSDEAIQLGLQALTGYKNAVVDYFEAKPQRAVALSEFKGAVVRKDTPQDVRNILEENGLVLREYETEADRAEAVAALTQELEAQDTGNVLFSRRSAPLTEKDAASRFAHVNERLEKASRSMGAPTVWQRAADFTRTVHQAFTRHFIHLDPTQDGAVINILREFQEAPLVAWEKAGYTTVKFIKDLAPAERKVFTYNLVLADMLRDLDSGLLDGTQELPFGYKNRQQVEVDAKHFQALARKSPEVTQALKDRREFMHKLRKDLVKHKLLPKSVLESDANAYFHHQVLEYMAQNPKPGMGSKDLRVKKKGWQFERQGSVKDYSTNYLEAELAVIAQGIAQVKTQEALNRIQAKADVKKTLEAKAKAANRRAMGEQLGSDWEKPFKQKIAIGFGNLGKMASNGEMDVPSEFTDIVEAMADHHEFVKANKGDLDKSPAFKMDSHPKLFQLLSWLVNSRGPGAAEAATVLKGIKERNAFIKSTLGQQFQTYRDLTPEGYVEWKPKPGGSFYFTNSVSDRVIEDLLSGHAQLQSTQVQQILARGRDAVWVIPDRVAAQLDEIRPNRDENALGKVTGRTLSAWKQWILLNPMRWVRYNMNNMSGDLDIALAYNPKMLKGAPQAFKDLWAAYGKGRWNVSEALRQELEDATARGVLSSGLTQMDIPDLEMVNNMDEFMDVLDGRNLKSFKGWAKAYWSHAKGFSTLRENILRLTAYRHFQERLRAGETIYAASRKEEVDAITDVNEKAAKLARELVGDYGNISHAGEYLRRHLVPFWSWLEVNAPRYVRLFRNLKHEGKGAGALSGAMAWKTTKFGLKAAALYGMIALWNAVMFPDEDDELREAQRNQLHLILGRREDGTIMTLRFQGAFSDALSWVGLENPLQTIGSFMKGDVAEELKGMAQAPVNKLWQGIRPDFKLSVTASTGYSTYPDVFAPRPVRDRMEEAFKTLSLDRFYNAVAGKPQRGGSVSETFLRDVANMFVYSTDGEENAYWNARGKVFDWMREQGKEPPSARPTNSSNALYYYRQALKFGDFKAAERYHTKYLELGGKRKNIRESIRRAHPLAGIPTVQRRAFRNSLSPAEQATLDRAIAWWRKTYVQGHADAVRGMRAGQAVQ